MKSTIFNLSFLLFVALVFVANSIVCESDSVFVYENVQSIGQCECAHSTNSLYSNVNVSQLKTPDERRQFVKHVTREAWNAYVRYAWGKSGVRTSPVEEYASRTFDNTGRTIVGSMTTLWVMGMVDEFEKGRAWIENRLRFSKNPTIVKNWLQSSVVSEYIGSMISCYALTGDEFFRETALVIGKNLQTLVAKKSHRPASEFMEQMLEYRFLSNMSNTEFWEKYSEVLSRMEVNTDSDYYLTKTTSYVKMFQMLNRKNETIQTEYLEAIKQTATSEVIQFLDAFNWTTVKRSPSTPMYYTDCQLGATFALAANQLPKNNSNVERLFKIANGIAELCHFAATQTPSGLPVISFKVEDLIEFRKTVSDSPGASYDLDPELFETYFVLYRLTGNEKYQEYAWQLFEAIYKHARTKKGYSVLGKVTEEGSPVQNGFQPPLFLSATLKYLYLINVDRYVLPLNEWIFNSGGHPLPVCGANVAFPKCE